MAEYSWRGTFDLEDVSTLKEALRKQIEAYQETIKQITASQAINLSPGKKADLIGVYTNWINEHQRLLDRIGK